jgi:hypothetical protein
MTDTHLLDDVEAGEVLRMLPRRVVRLAKRGIIPHVALPDGELRFRTSELLEWANQFSRPGAQEGVAHVG